MARRLVIEISESVEYLEKSLRNAPTGSQKEKLQVLWWLKSGQVTQHQDLSHRLGRNGATMSRWLQQYRQGGLSALLELKPRGGQSWAMSGEPLAQLETQLQQPEGFKRYRAIQPWLEHRCGKPVKYKTVYKTVRYRLQAKLKVPRPPSRKQAPAAVHLFKKTSHSPC